MKDRTPLHSFCSLPLLALLLGNACAQTNSAPEPAPASAPAPAAASTLPANKDLYPRLRGNDATARYVTPEMIEVMAADHCNVLRTAISVDDVSLNKPIEKQVAPTADNPLAPYEQNLKKLDAILPLCRAKGIEVIIVAGDVYGRHVDVFWKNTVEGSAARAHIPNFWKAMSARYKDEPAVVGYDIKNEPVYLPQDASGWWDDTVAKSMEAIRANDKNAWIVMENAPCALAWGFSEMHFFDDPRVLYSFHTYMPHGYSHQGVRFLQKRAAVSTRGKWTYPGYAPRVEGAAKEEYWDKAAVEKTMDAVVAFQVKHPTARIYVGEFGVIRWAPNGVQLLKDDIDIFEKHGWDWTFHSVGEWNGWDPTYAADDPVKNRPTIAGGTDTDRLKAVTAGWALNTLPAPVVPPPTAPPPAAPATNSTAAIAPVAPDPVKP